MTYRLAECLDVLRAEVNEMAPNRSKASDGWIGDAAHATRESDHNPWVIDVNGIGVVRAFDFTHDPAHGCDADFLAERFRTLGLAADRRLLNGGYVIRNSRICSSRDGWAWRPYTGINPHTKHVHISVSTLQRDYDNRARWGLQEDDVTPEDIENIAEAVWKRTLVLDETSATARSWLVYGRRDVGRILAQTDPEAFATKVGVLLADKTGLTQDQVKEALTEVLRRGTDPEA